MNSAYTSRQRKIWKDYSGWSSEKLLDILKNRDNYSDDIPSVIEEILKERNVPVPSNSKPMPGKTASESAEEYFRKEKEKVESERTRRKFYDELRESSEEEITDIITRYSSFSREKVEAALTISVDKGIVSYDLKNALLGQISNNLDNPYNRKNKYKWEEANAFSGFVSRYSDDKIYEIIDDPSEIVVDVYHAVLKCALERELISVEDFEEYVRAAKLALRSDREIRRDDIKEYLDLPEIEDEDLLPDEKMQEEAAKYWICPKCGELVENELDACWRCEGEKQEGNVIRPEISEMREAIKKERGKGVSISPVIPIFIVALILAGAMLLRDFLRHGEVLEDKFSIFLFVAVLAGFIIWAFARSKDSKDY